MNLPRPHNLARRRGTVLIVTMVVVFILAAMVLTLGKQVRTESLASANALSAQKADAAEHGAEQYVLSLLTDYQTTIPTLTETDFSAVPVGDAFFWISRPDYGDTTLPTWGILDESGKLPINNASSDMLAGMPGMTADLASAIVAYRGSSTTTLASDGTVTNPDTTTDTSTTTGTFTDNGDGTFTKNAPFETTGELLSVQGFTRDLLYGPPGASTATGATAASGSNDWYTTHGVADYFTAWNTSPNTAEDGTARVSYNDVSTRDALTSLLADKLGDTALANEAVAHIAPSRRGPAPVLTGIFNFAEQTGLTSTQLAKVEDYITRDATVTKLDGRININTASREVLLALGALSQSDVETLLAARPNAIVDNPHSVAWVMDAIGVDKAVLLGDLVCGYGHQYSADITAASGDGRGFRHVRVVVDTSASPAKIIYRRDLTERGWPLDPQILEQLKSGQFAAQNAVVGAR